MDKEQAIEEARRVWAKNITPLNDLKKRIREEAEAEIQRETERRREEAARAIHVARDAGATKVSLREVTTKDHWDFESYVKLGEELARGGESPAVVKIADVVRPPKPAVPAVAVMQFSKHLFGDEHNPAPGEGLCDGCYAAMEKAAPNATMNDWQVAMRQSPPEMRS